MDLQTTLDVATTGLVAFGIKMYLLAGLLILLEQTKFHNESVDAQQFKPQGQHLATLAAVILVR